ncbi:MAG TPA: N-acetyltransferase [Sphingomicrobium sp.]|jgi:putative acetyltransferase|nr:N-acetyltransferase [Sphingomicrobium sp.]
MKVRHAAAADAGQIRRVLSRAFPTELEADLVEQLERDGDVVISLVAEDRDIVGHLLLSRMRAEADGQRLAALGLGPVGVIPDRHGQGIGSALIHHACREARGCGAQMLFVLGEPAYYGRFGFDADVAAPFASPYSGPYFQALPLVELSPINSGVAEYPLAFAAL